MLVFFKSCIKVNVYDGTMVVHVYFCRRSRTRKGKLAKKKNPYGGQRQQQTLSNTSYDCVSIGSGAAVTGAGGTCTGGGGVSLIGVCGCPPVARAPFRLAGGPCIFDTKANKNIISLMLDKGNAKPQSNSNISNYLGLVECWDSAIGPVVLVAGGAGHFAEHGIRLLLAAPNGIAAVR